MKSLKRIHRTCVYEEFEENTYDMFIWRVTLHINMSYVFSSNSSYKHVLCILFKLFIYTCPMYSLQTLHINMSYAFSSNSSYNIGHVYMKSLKRIHRTCVYEEFEENTYDMFIWRVWKECIGHVYMKSLHMSYVFSSNSSYKHV
jgi:hypothetical protein